jgi:hypothetical protein
VLVKVEFTIELTVPYVEVDPEVVTNEHAVNVHAILGIVKYYEIDTDAY